MIAQAFDDDSDSEDVVEKRIHLLNVHYHTRVPVNSMRDVIIRLQKSEPFEKWIENGNVEAVKMIAICDGKNYFSFATKYCCFANPDMYPIFDSLSIKALRIFNESKSFYDEKIDFEKLRDGKLYEDYRKIVDGFIEKFGLEYEELSYKDLDKFLWLVGKNI